MKKPPLSVLIHFVLLAVFIIIISYLSFKYVPAITHLASKPEDFKSFLLSFGSKSILVFILIQVVQVVIAAIPGELIQVAGGYIYGSWMGTIYSLLGISLGSIIAFLIARILGYPILKNFIPSSQIDRFAFFINGSQGELATFMLFLIPGIPKDILTYLAGFTPMKPFNFIIIAIMARFPGILISSYIGANIGDRHLTKVAIACVLALIFFLVGILSKDKLINRLK